MGARRVLLTHFSQRYSKIPSVNSLDSLSVKLEDAEDVDPNEGMDQPADRHIESHAPIKNLLDRLDEQTTQSQTGAQEQESNRTYSMDSECDPKPTSAPSEVTTLHRRQVNDMKIGVAFDYMHVKVGEIAHLEKFTPALRELYKNEEPDRLASKITFSDDETEVPPKKDKSASRAEKARRRLIRG